MSITVIDKSQEVLKYLFDNYFVFNVQGSKVVISDVSTDEMEYLFSQFKLKEITQYSTVVRCAGGSRVETYNKFNLFLDDKGNRISRIDNVEKIPVDDPMPNHNNVSIYILRDKLSKSHTPDARYNIRKKISNLIQKNESNSINTK